jgi:hypothetical protein
MYNYISIIGKHIKIHIHKYVNLSNDIVIQLNAYYDVPIIMPPNNLHIEFSVIIFFFSYVFACIIISQL